MSTTSNRRSERSTDRARRLFSELETAQRRLLEMQLGIPTNPGQRRTGMLSQIGR